MFRLLKKRVSVYMQKEVNVKYINFEIIVSN